MPSSLFDQLNIDFLESQFRTEDWKEGGCEESRLGGKILRIFELAAKICGVNETCSQQGIQCLESMLFCSENALFVRLSECFKEINYINPKQQLQLNLDMNFYTYKEVSMRLYKYALELLNEKADMAQQSKSLILKREEAIKRRENELEIKENEQKALQEQINAETRKTRGLAEEMEQFKRQSEETIGLLRNRSKTLEKDLSNAEQQIILLKDLEKQMNLNTLKESEYQELHASKDSLTKHLENITVSLNSPTQLKVQQLDTHTNKNNINTSLFNSSEETLTSDQALRSSHSGKKTNRIELATRNGRLQKAKFSGQEDKRLWTAPKERLLRDSKDNNNNCNSFNSSPLEQQLRRIDFDMQYNPCEILMEAAEEVADSNWPDHLKFGMDNNNNKCKISSGKEQLKEIPLKSHRKCYSLSGQEVKEAEEIDASNSSQVLFSGQCGSTNSSMTTAINSPTQATNSQQQQQPLQQKFLLFIKKTPTKHRVIE